MKSSRCIALTLVAGVGLTAPALVARGSIRLAAQTPRSLATGQAAGPVKAFTGARVIDGTTAAPIDNATLLVSNGRLVAIGPAAGVTIPANATRTSLAGKILIPGLINSHGHVGDTEGLDADRYSAANVMRDLRLYAKYGVTSVISLGGDKAPAFAARDSQRVPTLDRARLWVAGPVLEPASPADARKLVAEDAALKVDIVKIRVDDTLGTVKKMPPEIYRAVIDEAHKRGLRVATHLFYLSDARALLDAGSDFVAHSVRDAEVDEPLIAALKKRNVCVSPTLMREVSTFVYETAPAFFSDPLFLKYEDAATIAALKDARRQAEMKASPSAQRYKEALAMASRNLKKLSDAGVTIAMGTDTGPPARFQGYFELMELDLMAKAGLTPRQVLTAATRDAARCMKIDSEVGTLQTGKWADFVVLDADPLADISNTKKISDVYIAGNRVAR